MLGAVGGALSIVSGSSRGWWATKHRSRSALRRLLWPFRLSISTAYWSLVHFFKGLLAASGYLVLASAMAVMVVFALLYVDGWRLGDNIFWRRASVWPSVMIVMRVTAGMWVVMVLRYLARSLRMGNGESIGDRILEAARSSWGRIAACTAAVSIMIIWVATWAPSASLTMWPVASPWRPVVLAALRSVERIVNG